MAIPSSGQLSLRDDIGAEFGAGSSNISLDAMAAEISDVAPHAMSEFYGVSAFPYVTDSIITHFDAQGATGTTWTDLTVGNGFTSEAHNINLLNGAAFTTVGGIPAMYLDGINDRGSGLVGPNRSDFKSWRLNPITVEIWFRSNGSFLSNGNLFHNGFNNEIRIRFSSSGALFVLANGMGSSTYTTFSTNTWYHLLVTIDSAGDLRIYRNASLIGSDTSGTYNPTYGASGYSTIQLGAYTSTTERGRFYYGLIRTYNKSFASADVTQNFNAEKSRFGY